MMWLDRLTLYSHRFSSKDLAAGVVQSCISGVQPGLHSDLESADEGNFAKRRKLEFSSHAGGLSCCPLIGNEKPTLEDCIAS